MTSTDIDFFMSMLSVDSTSGKEREFAEWLAQRLSSPANCVELLEVGDGTLNLRCSWGAPRVWLCSHLDTVPPYLPPSFDGVRFYGRGTCDAKGQLMSMIMASRQLVSAGITDFGLLFLAGEETGSFGAKAYDRDNEGGIAVIVGEPTGNRMVSASKGTRSFRITIYGKACHSGYPHLGESAVMKFVGFMNRLENFAFDKDPLLGGTTWNIGELHSDNPQNILSDKVTFRLYFRTTFATCDDIPAIVAGLLPQESEAEDLGGDIPLHYLTFEGYETTTVAFGSDAPRLTRFPYRILCGPGSIDVAHTDKEYVLAEDLDMAAGLYQSFVEKLLKFK